MLQTKIVNKEVCAVAYDPTQIKLRKRGKAYFGTEKNVALLKDDTLYINKDVASEYGIKIVFEETNNNNDDEHIDRITELPNNLKLFTVDVVDEESGFQDYFVVVEKDYDSAVKAFIEDANDRWFSYLYYVFDAEDETVADFMEYYEGKEIEAGIYDWDWHYCMTGSPY